MDKLLIGVITVLILFALIPIKSEPFTSTNLSQVSASIADDVDEIQPLFIRVDELNQMDNSELTQVDNSNLTLAENVVSDREVVEIEQKIAGSDRGIFLSIGSILLFGILLLLPLHLQKL